ncbi:MAG: DUF4097 family beta strand repeat-containing protein [Gemmatimonadales bacterium]
MRAIAMVAVLAVVLALPAAGQDFQWKGRIAAGQWLEIKGVNGAVRAQGAGGGEAEVVAAKTARRSDPESVEIRVVEHADGVTICAVYPTPDDARRENTCEPGEGWHSNNRNNDVTVNFTVRVPAGVKFRGQTVNGELEATGLGADAIVSTVNGSIRVSTRGNAEAHTVNGSIHATMGRADWTDEVDFRTVNGGITLTFPAELHTEIQARAVNGDIESDWPVTVRGRFGPKSVRGTIGNGGRTLHLETVNGSITLRKAT